MRKSNLYITIFYFGILIFLQSCNTYESEDCYEEKPEYGEIKIEVSINSENKHIPVEIFEGYTDTGKLIIRDTISEKSKNFFVTVNKYYSAKAYYVQNGEKITIVDGGSVKTYKTSQEDYTCWKIKNRVLHLKLL